MALNVIRWLFDHAVWSVPPLWLPDLPWSLMIWISVAFLGGQLLADLRNDRSVLRQLWRRTWRLFDVKQTFPSDGHAWVLSGASVTLRFVRPARKATILMHLVGTAQKRLVVVQGKQIDRGQDYFISLLASPAKPDPSLKVIVEPSQMRWNAGGEDEWTAHWGYEYVVTIEVQRMSFWTQSHKVYFRLPPQVCSGPNAPVTVVHEPRDIFDENAIRNYSGGGLASG